VVTSRTLPQRFVPGAFFAGVPLYVLLDMVLVAVQLIYIERLIRIDSPALAEVDGAAPARQRPAADCHPGDASTFVVHVVL
jgi:hypothetical protein